MSKMAQASTVNINVDLGGGRVLVSRSAAMQRVWELVQRAAPADISVLVTGETGTGKELVARLIHKLSPRAHKPLFALDCNAIAPALLESELFGHERGAFTGADHQQIGVFELADGSTLFLDEIGNLPLQSQAKMLRVLQEHEFRRLGGRALIQSDFRLVAATNADLAAAAAAGTFRGDLFHRLKVLQIALPPLRSRVEDIPLLVSHILSVKRLRLKRPTVCRVSHRAIDHLLAYPWPGNVRELENVIEAAVLACPGDTIEAEHLTLGNASGVESSFEHLELPFRDARQRALQAFERLYLMTQLRRFRGSIKQTAEHAGITTKHVRALMRRHVIDRRDFRPVIRPRVPSARKCDSEAG
ncbi:MAG TPA: sigma-54 dependent transcriptional regulator [Candidatus Binatia bacterium]|nr:sigma-54 dependent transcriptional regulator [Candidatus Binatia bacterium]